MGGKIVQVRTGAGVLSVTQRVNARNMLTGRIDGVTYEGNSWDDVVRQIRAKYTDDRVWTLFLVVRSEHPDSDNPLLGFDPHETDESAEATLAFHTAWASQLLSVDGVAGIWIRNSKKGRPRFQREALTPAEALGYEGDAVIPYTQELEARLRSLQGALREIARQIHAAVGHPDFFEKLLAAPNTLLALPGKVNDED